MKLNDLVHSLIERPEDVDHRHTMLLVVGRAVVGMTYSDFEGILLDRLFHPPDRFVIGPLNKAPYEFVQQTLDMEAKSSTAITISACSLMA